MENKFLKTGIIICICLLISTCNRQEEELIPQQGLTIEEATTVAKESFKSNLQSITHNLNTKGSSSDSNYNSDYTSYEINNLKKLTDIQTDRYLYSALNINDNSKSLTFSMDEDSGDIYDAFVTQTITPDLGDYVTSNIFSIEGDLLLSYDFYNDGTRNITYVSPTNNSSRSGINGWWSRFDRCAGQLNGPTDSNVANIFFVTIANAATLGLYTPLSLVVCAGVATAS